jgi:hypothetical protein
MRLYGKVLLLVIMMWPLLNPLAFAAGSLDPKRVLVLYADRPDLPAHRLFKHGLRSSLTASLAVRPDFSSEFMDVSRFSAADDVRSLRELYSQKCAGRKIDLIIASGRHALEFLLLHQEEFWPGIPAVFCGIDADSLANLQLGPHITGVVRQLRHCEGTVEFVDLGPLPLQEILDRVARLPDKRLNVNASAWTISWPTCLAWSGRFGASPATPLTASPL